MTKLSWDNAGERFYESGVDRGVLYPKVGPGVAWNGLVSVNETPIGGDVQPYYLDGIRYYNDSSSEEFSGSIEAFTYPDEFATSNGSIRSGSGISYEHQPRNMFDLSYRTGIGNDLEGLEYGYKIHLIYNATASPSSRSNNTASESTDISTFVWDISTIPEDVAARKPTSHFTLDSTVSDKETFATLEKILYGTSTTNPRIPSTHELVTMFDDWSPLTIISALGDGLSQLIYNYKSKDLKGDNRVGLYAATNETRLLETVEPGLFTLE